MPKLNVYVPDELAQAVKETGIPVSAVCQRALEQAVRSVAAVREVFAGGAAPEEGAMSRFTPRLRTALSLAAEAARERGAAEADTGDLLAGLLEEGENLALPVLASMEIDAGGLGDALREHRPADGAALEEGAGPRIGAGAAVSLEGAVTEAVALGHNYVGCEHLLIALSGDAEGRAGHVLRSAGADPRLTRRAVSAALAGYVHLRAGAAPAAPAVPAEEVEEILKRQIRPLVERIERLERGQGTG
ncbi:Clp protease N-terminal domain-containing protein [Nocardiopsis potens]|uniref:Clp protease N-terminal domain-containing protein n=1 Tax=Nocardiopsis potens TaxID=1246458 RepID=UPI00034A3F82|nr:Clp protease N-terminal domain-containing protein [Nocardiopsis potens]